MLGKSIVVALLLLFLFTKSVNAIVIIIPTVLVSIVSIIVWIITAISLPVVILSTLFFKIKNKSTLKGFLVGLLIVVLIALSLIIFLKVSNPARPFY